MKTFRSFSLSLLIAGLVNAQTAPTRDHHDEVLPLDTLVVSAGLDAKSAFDLAQGISILAGEKLHRNGQATLGETLAATPGVNATYYGPGASRPIIRGLGGDRVRMLDNGIGTLDASNISPDHNVGVEPLLVERIEVLRGPATLLYGSSAMGGVVNVIDNRIPSTAPASPAGGRTEFRHGSGANEQTGLVAFTGGNQGFALQVNGLRTETDDVAIPGYADPANPANEGTLVNSATSTRSGSLGGTLFGTTGFAGIAVSEYETVYGLPVGESIAIDMQQRRADFRAELTRPFGGFKAAKFRFGLADYTHAEIDTSTNRPNTTFHNEAYEGRVELVQQDRGALSGTIGLQTARSDFSAVGEEVVTPPTLTLSHALFALESWQVSPELAFQFGGRYEFQSIQLGEVDPLLPAYPGYAATSGEERSDGGGSLSAGLVYYPAKDYSLGFSAAYTQRLPVAQELYANGPHAGTGAYEIGSTGLDQESSLGLDLTLRKRAGFMTGSIGVFANRIQDFIFEQRDNASYFDEDTGTFLPYPSPADAEILPIYQFVARDALFYGGEAELDFHLVDTGTSGLHLDLMADHVHAEQTADDQPLPRIPPFRIGGGLHWTHGRWTAGASVRHAFEQDRVAQGETVTGSYTLVGADLTYRFTLQRTEWEFFAHGTNLTDEEARVSTSFLKDVAPLPGRNITLGLQLAF